jgi:hypothetical protein
LGKLKNDEETYFVALATGKHRKDTLTASLKQATANLRAAETKITTLTDEFEKKGQEKDLQHFTVINESNEVLQGLKEKICDLELSHISTLSKLAEMEREYDTATKKMTEEHKNEINKMMETNASLQKEVEAHCFDRNGLVEKHKIKVNELKDAIAQNSTEHISLIATLEDVKNEADAAQNNLAETLSQKNKECVALKVTVSQLEEKRDKWQKELNNQQRDHSAKHEAFVSEISALKKQINMVQTDLKAKHKVKMQATVENHRRAMEATFFELNNEIADAASNAQFEKERCAADRVALNLQFSNEQIVAAEKHATEINRLVKQLRCAEKKGDALQSDILYYKQTIEEFVSQLKSIENSQAHQIKELETAFQKERDENIAQLKIITMTHEKREQTASAQFPMWQTKYKKDIDALKEDFNKQTQQLKGWFDKEKQNASMAKEKLIMLQDAMGGQERQHTFILQQKDKELSVANEAVQQATSKLSKLKNTIDQNEAKHASIVDQKEKELVVANEAVEQATSKLSKLKNTIDQNEAKHASIVDQKEKELSVANEAVQQATSKLSNLQNTIDQNEAKHASIVDQKEKELVVANEAVQQATSKLSKIQKKDDQNET